MKVYDEKHIKNIVLLGSAKSGKTTLAETMLFEAGIINKRGQVENHNTISDYHEIEHQRESSTYATMLHTEWRDYKINIVDTPGLDDFTGEIVSSVRVADTCVMLMNAQYGVEVGTEIIWNYVDKFKKPTILAFNQLDHPKANFDLALESAKERFGDAVALMQYPVQVGEGFHQIIDLLKMTMYHFPDGGSKPEKRPIPENELERANQLHNELVEKAAENDESLLELYFEKGNLDEDELRQGLKTGMMNHDIFPVFCLSAVRNMGSGRMMGFIDNVAPAANDLPSIETVDGTHIENTSDAPTSLFIFKTLIEPYLGRINFFKVCSGEVKVGQELYNPNIEENERIGQLFIMDGKERNSVNRLVAGDIGATVKLKNSHTNHTLCDPNHKVQFEEMHFPEPKIRTAIVAQSKQDDEKLGNVIKELHEEDPTLLVAYSSELKQLILSGQGELHLATTKWRLENIYNLNIDFEEPKIPYRETIQKEASAIYRHKKQSGGAGQFAEVHLKIMPYYEGMPNPEGFPIRGREEVKLDWGGKLVFYNSIVGGAIDQRFLPSILKGILEVMEEGPITQSYTRDICVVVHDGKMHPVDSNDISFKIAGKNAFKDAFMKANPKIMQPIYNLQVLVPEDIVGEVVTDLQTRRSMILGIDAKGHYQLVKVKIPLAELDHYATALKSIAKGRASFTSQFFEYENVPYDLQQELMQNRKAVEA